MPSFYYAGNNSIDNNMNWELPSFDLDCKDRDFSIIEFSENSLSANNKFDGNFLIERNPFRDGWGEIWPKIPSMDANWHWNNCDEVDVLNIQKPCSDSVLGYYLPYHAVLKTYVKKYGRPLTHDKVLEFNENLPPHARYGIHLCERTILNFIDKTLQTRNYSTEYYESALALLLQTVIGHEWGHYRAELNGIQLYKTLHSLGVDNQFNYLEYFVQTRKLLLSDFEEVFADYCSLKFGVFNSKYQIPNRQTTDEQLFQMVKLRLSQSLFNNGSSPYGDLKFWMKNKYQMDEAIETLIRNPKYANRNVKLALKLNKAKSPFGSSLIDVLTHNQIQFIHNRLKNGSIVSSRGHKVDFDDLDSFWQYISNDSLMRIPLHNKNNSVIVRNTGHEIVHILQKISPSDKFKEFIKLPLPTYPSILPLNSVQIHD